MKGRKPTPTTPVTDHSVKTRWIPLRKPRISLPTACVPHGHHHGYDILAEKTRRDQAQRCRDQCNGRCCLAAPNASYERC